MKPSRRIALVGSIVLVTAAWPSIAQHPPIDAKVTVNKTIAGAVAYSNPALQVSGTIEATAGHRLYIVETTPKATLALLYEIPETATAIALKLPDGSVRSLR